MVNNHKIIISYGTGKSWYSSKKSVWMFSHDFQQNYCVTINTFTQGIFHDGIIRKQTVFNNHYSTFGSI